MRSLFAHVSRLPLFFFGGDLPNVATKRPTGAYWDGTSGQRRPAAQASVRHFHLPLPVCQAFEIGLSPG
jgi:hypothetical protein